MERAGVTRSVVCSGKWSLLLGDLGTSEHPSCIVAMVCLSWCLSPADDAGKRLIMGPGKCVAMPPQNILSLDISCSSKIFSCGWVPLQHHSPKIFSWGPTSLQHFPPKIFSWRTTSLQHHPPGVFSQPPRFGGGFGSGERCRRAGCLLGSVARRVPAARGNVLFSLGGRTVCPGCFPAILHGADAGQAVLGAEELLHPVSDAGHEAFNSQELLAARPAPGHKHGSCRKTGCFQENKLKNPQNSR